LIKNSYWVSGEVQVEEGKEERLYLGKGWEFNALDDEIRNCNTSDL
jgi:hypothetical protein